MHVLAGILRLIALSLLSGGSTAVVFAAVTLVKAATAAGVPIQEAATANAPIFINYAKIATGASAALLISLLIDLRSGGLKGALNLACMASSLACIIAASIYSFAIVPPMEKLLPQIKTVAASYEEFHRLHELSRAVFGASIAFAYLSLILPVFKRHKGQNSSENSGKTDNLAVGSSK